MANPAGARGRLAAAADNLPATTSQTDAPVSIAQLIERQKSELVKALPRHMDADRLARVALTVLKQTPRLMECTPQSLLGALMLSAQLGLEPGPLGHCYFVPFRNTRTGNYEVQWILGYRGIVDLAYRSGKLMSIEARDVRANDEFDFSYGLEPKLSHRPKMDGPRGELTAVYGVAHFKDGGHYFTVMSRSEVEEHRARSKSAQNGPWVTDYEAMARKTVVRTMAPYLPLSVEQSDLLAGAIANDGHVRTDVSSAMYDTAPPVIDVVAEPAVDVDTGEIDPRDETDGDWPEVAQVPDGGDE